MTVRRTRQLESLGQTPAERNRLTSTGGLVRVRHGAYADEQPSTALERHLQLIAGTVPVLGPEMVLSHVSAGVLHRLPCWDSLLDRVTVLRLSNGHGSRRRNLHVRRAPIEPSEVVWVEGYPLTSLARTAIDLACILDYDRAVSVLDSALHLEADFDVMSDTLIAARRRRGTGTARVALGFADGASESVGESISRIRMATAGVPAPRLQLNIFDQFGVWQARTDFGWEERGVLGEFDGKVKYTGPPDEVARTVMLEKQREDRLRELGWVVARWGWTELADPAALRRRIEAAFRQARPAAIRGYVEAA